MADEKVDVIVVGGGLAGLCAGYLLAKSGAEVMIIEKGTFSGSKNVSGGRLYARSMEAVIPGFAETAPVERKITKERFSVLSADGIETVERDAADSELGVSYSVLRGSFDKWLSEQAENEGAMYISSILVTDLIVRDGRVCGVVAGEEEMEADVVLLADGVNSLLAQKLGMRGDLEPTNTTVGVKDVIELDPAVMNARLGIDAGDGLAWMMFAKDMDTCVGDVFLYTNKDCLSLGVITPIHELDALQIKASELLETLKLHPAIAPLVEGGRLAEYSAHLVPQGKYSTLPRLYGDGVLVAGDAAELALDLRYMIRGMDFAIESGRLAAETILAAKEKGDFSAETLSQYKTALDESYLIHAMQALEQPREIQGANFEALVQTNLDEITAVMEGR